VKSLLPLQPCGGTTAARAHGTPSSLESGNGASAIHLAELGWWRVALGTAPYVAFLIRHGPLFGASALPR
jgi:hypothetical protein